MKQKIWVIGALLLLVASTSLAQNYNYVIERKMNKDLVDIKVTNQPRTGVITVTPDLLTIDSVKYDIIELSKEEVSKDFKYVTYVIVNQKDKSQRTYSCTLSYDNNSKLMLVEIWKSRLNCTYYVFTTKETTNTKGSSSNTRLSPHPQAWNGALTRRYNQR